MQDKKCNWCLVEKTIDGFHKLKISEDGYDKVCKICRNNKRSKNRTLIDKNRRNNNELFKKQYNIRREIRRYINKPYSEKSKAFKILGCSHEQFIKYIESKFETWMNWNNKGLYNGELNYGWDIDHIIPVSTAITEEDVIRLNHYTNLRPLCSKVNRNIKNNWTC